MIMMEKGNAEMISIFSNPSIPPPKYITIAAMDDNVSPQMTLTVFAGLSWPLVLNIPIKNVPETAELNKTTAKENKVTKDKIRPKLQLSNMPNVTVSVANSESCAMPSFSTNNADPPKTAKNIKVTSVGASRTPVINCLIVLPFDTLAINIPTNGAQEIHHDQ